MSDASFRNLVQFKIPDQRQAYGPRDCILYVLGLGLGYRREDRSELRHVYEEGSRTCRACRLVVKLQYVVSMVHPI